MSNDIYLLNDEGKAQQLALQPCKDEGKELQELLLKNPQMLPSDQIDPDNPPRWFLIKREMPVRDPATAESRWAADFLFVDHMGVLTLVECKRHEDTRSRREVIAQMLEYAANGQHYWSAAELMSLADDDTGREEPFGSWLERCSQIGTDPGSFMEAAVANLRNSVIRLIFFLDRSPNELRSLVDFLNRQLKATEVLIVEARQYESPAGRLVVPWLFGYTEEARVAKSEAKGGTIARPAGGKEAYFEALNAKAPADVRDAVLQLLNELPRSEDGLSGITFKAKVMSALYVVPVFNRALLHIYRSGDVVLAYGNWSSAGEAQRRFIERFAQRVKELFGSTFGNVQLSNYPPIKPDRWMPKRAAFVEMVRQVVTDGLHDTAAAAPASMPAETGNDDGS